jgi:hypothetical protein
MAKLLDNKAMGDPVYLPPVEMEPLKPEQR